MSLIMRRNIDMITEEPTNIWDVLKAAAPWVTGTTGFVLTVNKIVGEYFKYKVSFFDDRTRELIREENAPLVESVNKMNEGFTKSIAELNQAIGSLRNKQ